MQSPSLFLLLHLMANHLTGQFTCFGVLSIDDKVFHLKQGDSFSFPSERPHSYRNPGSTTLRIVWVSTPLTF